MSNLDKIKEKLIERKTELETAFSGIYKGGTKQDQVSDTGDQALSTTLGELKISLQDTELNEYKSILKALDRIEDGTYGICEDCGKPISEKRLMLFPNSIRCLACQELLEES